MHWQNLSQEQEVIAMLKIIHMKVNGKEHELAVDERESLLDTLRLRLGLTRRTEAALDGRLLNECLLDRRKLAVWPL